MKNAASYLDLESLGYLPLLFDSRFELIRLFDSRPVACLVCLVSCLVY